MDLRDEAGTTVVAGSKDALATLGTVLSTLVVLNIKPMTLSDVDFTFQSRRWPLRGQMACADGSVGVNR